MKLAQTSHAKQNTSVLKKQRRDENIEKGRELVEKEVRSLEYEMKEVLAPDNLKRVAEKFNFANEEDMFAAVGYNGITASQIVTRLTDKFRKQREEEEIVEVKEVRKPMKIRKWDSGVKVSGADNLLIRLSKCCNPVPGDDIVGYITKGRGVSIHRRDCVNVHTEEAIERLLEVEWEGSPEKKLSITLILKFQVTIAVVY